MLHRETGRARRGVTSLLGSVHRLVRLDEDRRAFAVHRHGGVILKDVALLRQLPVAPHLQVGLSTQPGGHLIKNRSSITPLFHYSLSYVSGSQPGPQGLRDSPRFGS